MLRFEPSKGEPWVGNFQKGDSHYCAFHELNAERVAIVAGGQGYVIDAVNKDLLYAFAGDAMCLMPMDGGMDFLTIGNTHIERHSSTQLAWRSRKIAWDGIGRVALESSTLIGQARRFDDTWHAFCVDLRTGQHTGGAFSET
ncbi:hypothetical protein [Ideonella sp.]|uniref:hypothetical protein n=1 Tax=Ideonella sp. TaxID=1929293 RepID=UPI003BB54BD0